jgi:hypothetical protein
MKLECKELTFKNGINLTVRKGVMWDLQLGRNASIAQIGKPSVCEARIVDTKVIRGCDIDEILDNLHLECDPKCRTKEGLLKEMSRSYGVWRPEEIVTLVYFEIL